MYVYSERFEGNLLLCLVSLQKFVLILLSLRLCVCGCVKVKRLHFFSTRTTQGTSDEVNGN